ncbi:MAG: hypothetical protein M3373_09850 [Gemmatimonadota bacterium]|nr:hypothetical protein [Gemmatimonadota bacterium]
MTTPSSGPSGFGDAEVNLGGADAVQKTSSVTGEDTQPERRKEERPGTGVPAVGAGGMGALGWGLVLAVAAIVAYFGLAFLG